MTVYFVIPSVSSAIISMVLHPFVLSLLLFVFVCVLVGIHLSVCIVMFG